MSLASDSQETRALAFALLPAILRLPTIDSSLARFPPRNRFIPHLHIVPIHFNSSMNLLIPNESQQTAMSVFENRIKTLDRQSIFDNDARTLAASESRILRFSDLAFRPRPNIGLADMTPDMNEATHMPCVCAVVSCQDRH